MKKGVLAATAVVVALALLAALVYRPGARRPSQAGQSATPVPGGVRIPALAGVAGPRFTRANVIVISIDTLRRDHVAPYGGTFETPAASRLAREGVVFDHAVSHVPLTLPSHTSIFTGLYPPHHGVRDNGGFVLSKDVPTLAEQFLRAGYQTAGFVSSYVLHSRWGIGRGHQTYDDSFDYGGLENRALIDVERPAGAVVDAALVWLRKARRADRPFYLWVHLYDPHEPYTPPDEYRRRAPTAYAGEVMYADAQAARLLDALDALGLRRSSLIVYLSDHGESLGEHGEPTHGIFLYGATLDVPLIVAPPSEGAIGSPPLALPGRRVRGLARLVDVMPTALDLVGLAAPPRLDGTSLLPLVASEATSTPPSGANDGEAIQGPVSYAETYYPRFHYGWSELMAMETSRWKFIRAPRPELYDVTRDPRENRDAWAEFPRVAATLARQLESMNPVAAREAPSPAKIDPEALARLRALGYVGSSDAPPRRTGPLPDPKDGMPLLRELLEAQGDRDAGRLDLAATRLEALAHKDPDNPEVFLALSSVQFRRNDAEAAIRAAQRAVALTPDSSVATLDLAFAFQAGGRLDDAATGFERVLALDPGNVKAMLALGDIWRAKGDRQKALNLYERAATLAPRFAGAQVSLASAALDMNRLDMAERALRQAAALGGSERDLHFNLGVIAEQRAQRALAVREYQTEVAAHPDNLGAWVNLGLLERQAGKTDAALSAFEHAASAKGDAIEGPYLMAETLAALGRRQEAERWATEAVRRGPNDVRAQQLLKQIQK